MKLINYDNRLPVNTWNHLKVNLGSLALELPDDIDSLTVIKKVSSNIQDFVPDEIQLIKIKETFVSIMPRFKSKTDLSFGNCLFAPKYSIAKEPLLFQYSFSNNMPYSFEETYVYAAEGSELTLLMDYQSLDESAVKAGNNIRIYAEKNARVRLMVVQLLPMNSEYFENMLGYTEEGASIEVTQVEFGALNGYVGSEVILDGDRSSYQNDVIYLGKKNQTIDMNYNARHFGKNSNSKIQAKGTLDDESKKIFRATIDFNRGCTNASGEEGEETLLLSPNVKDKSIPLILCGEDNVSGAHAANIGKLDEDQLFYLMARGLSEAAAKQLLIRSRFKGIFSVIPNDELKENIDAYIKRSIQNENNRTY